MRAMVGQMRRTAAIGTYGLAEESGGPLLASKRCERHQSDLV